MKQTILVTGGTGYVGSWVVKGLLENGHTVRLTVRDKSKQNKYQFLVDIANTTQGSLEIWEANLLEKGSFNEATKGCDSIAHIASPFILKVKNAQKDLVDPAVNGTINVLEAANKSETVKKIVLTSSVASVLGDNVDMKTFGISELTEEHFNTTSTLTHQSYSFSKVEAEKMAWEMAKAQSDWQLIVMNPAFVMGPSLTTTSQSGSLTIMKDILSGKYKTGAPELHFGYVDVRDIAKAHIFGLENKAEGRHILSGREATFLDLANSIEKSFPNTYKLPKSFAPKWIMSLIGFMFGVTRKFVKNNVGHPLKLNNSKSKLALKLNYIPFDKTIKDMVEQMKKLNVI